MNKELAKFIKSLRDVDQDARFNADNKFIIYCVDGVNEYRINKIIEKYGYPTSDLLGKEGLVDFWMLIKNMEFDLELQEKCLENCDFEQPERAHLYDRIQDNKGLDQKYGTLLNKLINNLEETDIERLKIGWITVVEWIENFNKTDELNRKIGLKKNDDGSAEYLR